MVQQYVELFVMAAIAWYLEPWRPARPGRGAPIGDLLRFGGYFTASAVVMLFLTNIDKLLVGRVLGAAALGLLQPGVQHYEQANRDSHRAAEQHHAACAWRSAHDRQSFTQIVLAFERLVAVLSFPAGIGLMVVAHETMLVFGGLEMGRGRAAPCGAWRRPY